MKRGTELRSVYEEIEKSLGFKGVAWKVFLDYCVLATGTHWTPEQNKKDRVDRKRLVDINRDIADLSARLTSLLEERNGLDNRTSFTSNTIYHPVEVIDRANEGNGRYRSYLKTKLEDLRQFDLRYWPALAKMVRVIGLDAEESEVTATDPRTEAMSQSTRPSKADFIRAIREGIQENQHSGFGGLPKSFQLSDESVATLSNVLLDLPPDTVMDSKYVRNIRERDQRRQA